MSVNALFVSRGLSRAGWYRVVLPAMFGGWDWAAIDGSPPGLQLASSWVDRSTAQPDFMTYDVIVLQQVRGGKWANLIRKMRSKGVKVLYEIDDYVHGIRNLVDHDFARFYQKRDLKEMDSCMRECDGLIVSTQLIADKYRRVMRDRPVWVCENGLDMGRYRLSRPARGEVAGRETVTILWSGATGHQVATLPWVDAVMVAMRRVPHTTFVSIGQDFSSLLKEEFGNRVLSIPFTALETYPAAMTLGDVVIAPAGDSDWARAKSQLRAMEAAALGIAIVADKFYAPTVVDGETGLIARSVLEVPTLLKRLVDDDEERRRMGDRARERAYSEFEMSKRVRQWSDVLEEVVS